MEYNIIDGPDREQFKVQSALWGMRIVIRRFLDPLRVTWRDSILAINLSEHDSRNFRGIVCGSSYHTANLLGMVATGELHFLPDGTVGLVTLKQKDASE